LGGTKDRRPRGRRSHQKRCWPGSYQNRALKDSRPVERTWQRARLFPGSFSSASQPSSSFSALYHSPLISTALPRRGVHTQSSDLGIHPGERVTFGTLRHSPSRESTPIPKAVPRRCHSKCPAVWATPSGEPSDRRSALCSDRWREKPERRVGGVVTSLPVRRSGKQVRDQTVAHIMRKGPKNPGSLGVAAG